MSTRLLIEKKNRPATVRECTLASVLAKRRSLPVPQGVELIRSLAVQVDDLHTRGIIHRAIAPDAVHVDAALFPTLVENGLDSSVFIDGSRWGELLPELSQLVY